MYSHDKRQRKHTKLKMNARSKACILSRGITLSNAKIDFKIMKYLCCAQHVCYLIDTHFSKKTWELINRICGKQQRQVKPSKLKKNCNLKSTKVRVNQIAYVLRATEIFHYFKINFRVG